MWQDFELHLESKNTQRIKLLLNVSGVEKSRDTGPLWRPSGTGALGFASSSTPRISQDLGLLINLANIQVFQKSGAKLKQTWASCMS